ncbi:MAG: C40 family peptidase [Chloroflexi bacterium]|nr:C40 family peptidase [Chloroflexota bacterium]
MPVAIPTATQAQLGNLGDAGSKTRASAVPPATPKVSFGQFLADRRRALATSNSTALSAFTAASGTASLGPIGLPEPTGIGPAPVARVADTGASQYLNARGASEAPRTAPPVAPGVLSLDQYPRPTADNGRGIHWVPTVSSSKETVDRFVNEAEQMGIRWVTLLNDGTDVGDNDYLVKQIVSRGMMPVMRVYTPNGSAIDGNLGAMVRHYVGLGVPYFQLYNEPNLTTENGGAKPDVNKYLDKWTTAAKTVIDNGGLPGFGALAPGADFDDLQFLRQAVSGLKSRGETRLLDRAWLSIHNYMFNRPVDYQADSNGFMKFRAYDQILNEGLGRGLPMIGTEGGALIGWHQDPNYPAVDSQRQALLLQDAFRYMGQKREPYNFAYSPWAIANKAGGGSDPQFESHALFSVNGPTPAVAAIKELGIAPTRPSSAGASAPRAAFSASIQATAPGLRGPAAAAPPLGQKLVDSASKLLGSKYVWGGHGPSSFDCTGFTWYVARQNGLQIPQHDLAGQMKSGPRLQKSELRAGDLVFFQNTYQPGLSHVGIAMGDGRFIHAASEKQGVIVSKLDEPYWAQRYVGATRPVSS